MPTLDLLDRLISFPSISVDGNLGIADFIADHLGALGFAVRRLPDASGQKVGLLARIGPAGDGGALLSAHMDVVPVTGQNWTRPPFRLTREGGRVFGRGTTDMKGFLASALTAAELAARAPLARPFSLSLSYDEELGCLGIRDMIGEVARTLGRPDLCIVGEPTSMRVATGHKGKGAYLATFRGRAGHSAMAPAFLNALHLAADFVTGLRMMQARLAREGQRDDDYDIAYSTVHAGRMQGGVALNIVPDSATVLFEIRHLAAEPLATLLGEVRAMADAIVKDTGHPAAAITIEEVNAYPGLDTPPGAPVVERVRALSGGGLCKVAYGTEAGFFAAEGIRTIVCGPGSMDQGHQPDEYIDIDQLDACDRMLARLVADLAG